MTNNPTTRRSILQRPPSYAKNRMSSYSAASNPSQNRSRPSSHAFPTFHSSLPYTLVRDFAYPIMHPYHYGPPVATSANQSGNSTPASEFHRRLSDPSATTWEGANPLWAAGPWGGDGFFATQPLLQMAYGDGPPYSEDEDLHSPVVVSSRHKKSKSTAAHLGGGQERGRGLGRGSWRRRAARRQRPKRCRERSEREGRRATLVSGRLGAPTGSRAAHLLRTRLSRGDHLAESVVHARRGTVGRIG